MKVFLVNPEDIDWRQVKRFLVFVGVLLLFTTGLIFLYKTLLVPFALSMFFTFLLAPLVKRLERLRIPRGLIVSLLLAIVLALLTLASVRILPSVYEEVVGLIKMIPAVFETVVHRWLPSLREFVLGFDMINEQQLEQLIKDSRIFVQTSEQVQQALSTLWYSAPRVLGTVVNMVMTPLITFFLLKDYDKLGNHLLGVVPRDLQSPVLEFSRRVAETFRAVIKGQLTVAAILAALYMLGFSVVGLHAGWAIGLVAGLCRLIPYLDVLAGATLSLVVIFSDFQGMGQIIAVALVFLIVQTLDGMIITPRVIGERVGLHPLVVILSVICFGDIFGFWGVLLAIPLVAMAQLIWLSVRPFYLASTAYDLTNERYQSRRKTKDS